MRIFLASEFTASGEVLGRRLEESGSIFLDPSKTPSGASALIAADTEVMRASALLIGLDTGWVWMGSGVVPPDNDEMGISRNSPAARILRTASYAHHLLGYIRDSFEEQGFFCIKQMPFRGRDGFSNRKSLASLTL